MTNNPIDTPSKPLFCKLKLLNVKDIYNLKTATAVKRMIANNTLDVKELNSSRNIYNYETRHSAQDKLAVPKINTNFGEKSLKFQCPSVWNKIPLHLRDKSLNGLKFQYKSCLIVQYKL